MLNYRGILLLGMACVYGCPAAGYVYHEGRDNTCMIFLLVRTPSPAPCHDTIHTQFQLCKYSLVYGSVRSSHGCCSATVYTRDLLKLKTYVKNLHFLRKESVE